MLIHTGITSMNTGNNGIAFIFLACFAICGCMIDAADDIFSTDKELASLCAKFSSETNSLIRLTFAEDIVKKVSIAISNGELVSEKMVENALGLPDNRSRYQMRYEIPNVFEDDDCRDYRLSFEGKSLLNIKHVRVYLVDTEY